MKKNTSLPVFKLLGLSIPQKQRAKQMNRILLDNFPYKSQLDNGFNPYGSCNVTSYEQLEDQMYRRCLDRGWSRHSPHDLKLLAESYPGIKDDFTDRGTFKDIKQALASNCPVVLHGYFTRFGHIITAKGFDDYGIIANDPYGEWFEGGYDTSVSGENLAYSWGLVARKCSPESVANPQHIWMHKLYRTD